MKNTKKPRGNNVDRKKMLREFDNDVLEVLNGSDKSRSRQFIISRVVNKKPYRAIDLSVNLRKKIYDSKILKTIKSSMSITQQRNILASAEMDLNNLVSLSEGRVTIAKKRLANAGQFICSSSSQGMILMKKANEKELAMSIKYIAGVNLGHSANFNALKKRFESKCKNKALISKVRSFANTAMNKDKLEDLIESIEKVFDV